MAFKLGDYGDPALELAKGIPAAIEGYYDARHNKMKELALQAKMKAEERERVRQIGEDRLKLEQEGYEFPEGEVTDPMGLLAKGQLKRRQGYLGQKDLDRQLKQAQIEYMKGRGRKQEVETEKARAQKPMTVGQQKLEQEYAKEYNQFVNAGGYTGLDSAVSELENAIEKIKVLKPGKIEAKAGEMTGGMIAGDAFDIQQNIQKVIQGSLRETLGAQFTEKEASQLLSRVYNPNLGWEKNYERAKAELEKIKKRAEAKKAAARHFEEKGEISSFRGIRNQSQSPKMANEAPRKKLEEYTADEIDQMDEKMLDQLLGISDG